VSWTVDERVDREAWSAFVAGHPDGNVFQTPEMFDVFARTRGHRPRVLAVRDGAEILALFTPVDVSLSRLPRLFSTRSIAYGGLLAVRDERGPEAAAMLLERNDRLTPKSSLFTEVRNVADPSATDGPVRRAGYEFADHLNYLVDLRQSPDAILAGMDARVRSTVRRAIRQGAVEIAEGADGRARRAAYGLLEGVYRRVGVPLADRSLFDAAFDVLGPRGMARLWLAHVDGRPAACIVGLLDARRIFYWYAGSDRALTQHKANELVTWSVLEWGAANGYETFDWGGAGAPSEPYGVRDFKRKFGGREVNFGRYTRVHAPNRLALSSRAYWVFRSSRQLGGRIVAAAGRRRDSAPGVGLVP
jgi:serine/alanine adding enzyme